MKAVAISLILAALNARLAQAASGAGEDSSSVFTWIFFGMMGLIIAVLLVPAVNMLRDLAGEVEEDSDPLEEKLPRK